MSKHTPGPWVIDTDGDDKANAIVTSTHLPDGPDDDVCEVYGGNSDDDEIRAANARLIAEAPAMLEALRNLLPLWSSGIEEPWVRDARAILARIEGDQP